MLRVFRVLSLVEALALLGYYAAYAGSCLLTFWGQPISPTFGVSWPLKMGLLSCSETSVMYQHVLCNIPEKQGPHKLWLSTWPVFFRLKWDTMLTSVQVDIWVLKFENFWLCTLSGYQVGTGWSDSFFSSFPLFQNACVIAWTL